MATNLRLDERTTRALRDAAAARGTSQQQLIREAIEQFLGLTPPESVRDRAIRDGLIRAGTPHEDFEPFIDLPAGVSSLDLLDRDDR